MSHPTAPTVRALRAEDQVMWRDLWKAYLAFYGTFATEDVIRTTFARLTDPQVPDMRALVAETGGAVAGIAHVILHPHCWRIEKVCYLQDLFTAPEHRGRGLGGALIAAVYRLADESGAPVVYWTTQSGNATARSLYDRVGRVTDFIKYQRP